MSEDSILVSHRMKLKNPLNVTQKNRPKNNYMKETAASLQKKKNKYENNTISKPFFFTTGKIINSSTTSISQSVRKMSLSQPVCKSSYNWNDNNSYNDNLNHFTDDNNFGNDTYNHFV